MELINVGSPPLRLAFALPICLACTLRTHRHGFCDVFALRAFTWDRGRGQRGLVVRMEGGGEKGWMREVDGGLWHVDAPLTIASCALDPQGGGCYDPPAPAKGKK